MYGSRRGACFRCGKYGHFARECYQPRVEPSSVFAGGGLSAPPAPKLAPPPKPDPTKTQRWQVKPLDEAVIARNDREFRVLLKILWERLTGLVQILFARFGGTDLQALAVECPDGSFLEKVPITGELKLLTEMEFQQGRRAEAHFTNIQGIKHKEFMIDPLNEHMPTELRSHKVSEIDLQLFGGTADTHGFNQGWWHKNGSRHGIPATLHRISGISGRQGELIGVVIRVGRTVTGIVEKMLPENLRCSSESVLLVGPPNSGKTTVLREFARLLSDQDNRVVVVVDKTSEIAGASNEPHPAIGTSCRWVPVDDPKNQYSFMRMAVENLSPDTLIVDEISTDKEVTSAKTISQRGVQLIATCHGKSMIELVNDEDRSGLLGGVKSVTLSKQEVDARVAKGGGGEKQVMMRKFEPLFGTVIELHGRDLWYVHQNPKDAVDAWLRREPVVAWRATPGQFEEVLAVPTEEGFRYEPELPGQPAPGPRKRVATMSSKGSDVQLTMPTTASNVPTPARNSRARPAETRVEAATAQAPAAAAPAVPTAPAATYSVSPDETRPPWEPDADSAASRFGQF